MNRHIILSIGKAVLAIMFASALPASVAAQEYVSTPVEISKERVKIGGKICYSHIVLEKQTLYSISKAYGVSAEDIYKYNPGVKENGLKKNTILIIPTPEAVSKENKPEQSAVPVVSADTVKQQKPSPDKTVSSTTEVATTDERAPRIHVRKWYEDLDAISEKYGVSVEHIMKANNLTGRKLSNRQKLIIPYPDEIARFEDTSSVAPTDTTVTSEAADTLAKDDAKGDIPAYIFPKNKINAALLLPFKASEETPSRSNLDFYSGVLLAVKELGESGINIDLEVRDINAAPEGGLETSDIIIGPVSTSDLTRTLVQTESRTPVISPLDPKAEKLAATYDNFIQAPTPHKAQYEDLVNWISEEYREGDKILMISEKGMLRQPEIYTDLKAALDSSRLSYNTFSYNILEGRDVMTPLTELMTSEGSNRVLIASESEAFVNDVVRNLNLLIYNNLDVVLYGASKIRSFETIEVDNFHNASLHVSLTYYIDYEDAGVQDFLMKYRALFNTEPNQFAFQGYDVAKYFIGLCRNYGDNWQTMIGNSDADMLQSTFKCRKEGEGFVNTGVRRIIYGSGYSIERVK